MKKVLALMFILFINSIYALEVEFSCPDVVYVGQEFKCLLEAENFTGIYDAKVDISIDGKVIAEILDDKWKSAYYYLYGFVDDEKKKEIRLRISEDYEGEIEGVLKLRKDSKMEFFYFNIEVKSNGVSEKEVVGESEEVEEVKGKTETPEEIIKKENYTEIKDVISLGKQNLSEPEDIKTFNNVIYESKNEQIKKYSVFGFALLCLIFSILVIIKKL